MNLTWGSNSECQSTISKITNCLPILWLVNFTWGLNSGNDTPFVGGRSLALRVGGAYWASWLNFHGV